MSIITCEFCFKNFKNNYTLIKHKLSAKYCLNIQEKKGEAKDEVVNNAVNDIVNDVVNDAVNNAVNDVVNDAVKNEVFKCEKCDKVLISKQNLNLHILACKEILKWKLSEKDTEILSIKKEYDKHLLEIKIESERHLSEKDVEILEIKIESERHLSEKDDEILEIKKEYERRLSKHITEHNNFKNDVAKKQEKYTLEIIKYQTNIENKDEIIDDYKKQILDLQNRLERLHVKAIEKPTNSTTNNNKFDLKCFNLSQENINDKISSKFNDNYMYNGMSGLARFVKDHIITLEDGSIIYACYDKSRQIFKYKDKDGNIINDPKALKLIAMIQPALKEQSQLLLDFFDNEYDSIDKCDKNEIRKIQNQKDYALKIGIEISNMHENPKFSNELSNIIS